jgi:hypothetical protein
MGVPKDYATALLELEASARLFTAKGNISEGKKLSEIVKKLTKNLEKVVDIAEKDKYACESAEMEEKELLHDTGSELEDNIGAWKALQTLSYAISEVGKEIGLNESEKDTLIHGITEALWRLEDRIPILYGKYKAFKEFGWDTHHTTFKDTLYFLVPLVIFIMLERR